MTTDLPEKVFHFYRYRIIYCVSSFISIILIVSALFSYEWALSVFFYPEKTIPDKFGILPGSCYSEYHPQVCETWRTKRYTFITVAAVLVGLSAALQLLGFTYNLLLLFVCRRKCLRVLPLAITPLLACAAFLGAYFVFQKNIYIFGDDVLCGGVELYILFSCITSVVCVVTVLIEIGAIRKQTKIKRMERRQEQRTAEQEGYF